MSFEQSFDTYLMLKWYEKLLPTTFAYTSMYLLLLKIIAASEYFWWDVNTHLLDMTEISYTAGLQLCPDDLSHDTYYERYTKNIL